MCSAFIHFSFLGIKWRDKNWEHPPLKISVKIGDIHHVFDLPVRSNIGDLNGALEADYHFQPRLQFGGEDLDDAYELDGIAPTEFLVHRDGLLGAGDTDSSEEKVKTHESYCRCHLRNFKIDGKCWCGKDKCGTCGYCVPIVPKFCPICIRQKFQGFLANKSERSHWFLGRKIFVRSFCQCPEEEDEVGYCDELDCA